MCSVSAAIKQVFSNLTIYSRFVPVALLVLLVTVQGFAGGGDGAGGGVGFQCGNQVFLADTYPVASLSERKLFSPTTRSLNTQNAIFILSRLHHQGFISTKRFNHLVDVISTKLWFDPTCTPWLTNDDNISAGDIPLLCSKVQIASQRHGLVCYDNALVRRMSPIDVGMLIIHEAYVYFDKSPYESTARIRSLVESMGDELRFKHIPELLLVP